MTQEIRDFVTEQANALLAAGSCCEEGKAAAQAWLDAAGTDQEAKAAADLVQEMKEDVSDIDGTIVFAQSETAKQIMGEEGAKGFLAQLQDAKAKGGKYCICPACTAGAALLERKKEILA